MPDDQFHTENHYVPAVYLKRWARLDGCVAVYRLLVNHSNVPLWDRKSPRGVARHQHLYTRAFSNNESDAIERWLDHEFESPAAGALEKATTDARLSDDDYHRLIRFMAAQDVRTPARLLEILQRGAAHTQAVMTETLERVGKELKDAVSSGVPLKPIDADDATGFPARVRISPGDGGATTQIHVETVVGRGHWLFAMRHLLTKTLDHLAAHRWTILRSSTDFSWVTSDDPVVKLNWHGPGNYDFKGGWGSPGTEIFLPLGPRHLLYTKVGTRPPARGTILSIDAAREFQGAIVQHAWRHVVAVDRDLAVEQIRHRTVDDLAFKQEAERWRRWHAEQSAVERALTQ